ncbi:MAG: porin [Alkalilacustris sp.]
MKKILLAAAATSMVAGPVAAQGIDLSGYARFGFQFLENATGGFNDGEVTTNSRFRLNMNASAETDFGATVYVFQRAQTSANTGGATTSFAAPRFGVRGGGLDVRVGNIGGAIEDMPGHYFGSRSAGIGLAGLGFQNMAGNMSGSAFVWDAFSSAGSGPAAFNGVEAVYSAAGFRAQLSYTDGARISTGGGTFNERIAATLAYTFGEYTAAIGVQEVSGSTNTQAKIENQLVIATFGANFDQFRVNVQAADRRGVKKVVLNGAFNATPEATIYGFIANESGNRPGLTEWNGTSGGIGLAYALGGGASIETGVVRTSNSTTAADFGLFFSF